LHKPFEELIPEQLLSNEIKILSIKLDALSLLGSLPFHHRDPFDRLIIAQALTEKIPIISIDSEFELYPVELIWQTNPT
jgi:PIN domain nuclease of toxin-antitoxin system